MPLKELFKKEKCTQEYIAQQMKVLNCKKYRQQISEWVRGERLPDAYSIWCLSKILGVSADEVLEACLESAGRL